MPRNRTIIALAIAIFMLSGFVAAGPSGIQFDVKQSKPQPPPSTQKQTEKAEKSIVQYYGDVAKQVLNEQGMRLVGNVAFHHNGVIIQCDSARRYDEQRMDCFGNVIINQDSTYIYGDRVTYDGNINMAHIYAPLIKVTSGSQTVMYTYIMNYNTSTQLAIFSGGGIVLNADNYMESESGIFNSATNDVTLNHNVSMRNETYKLRTDSLRFNLDTKITTFLSTPYIWDKDKDFLTSKSGTYNDNTKTYTFTEKAYLMTADQEVWADSVIYISTTKEAFLRQNAQILDSAQHTVAFGDDGYYNDSLKKAIMTRKPSLRSWDKVDTSYMKADSIYFETFPLGTTKPNLKPEIKKATDKQPAIKSDSSGKPVIDTITKPVLDTIMQPILDSLGKPVLDSLGLQQFDTIVKQKLDSLGQPVFENIVKQKLDSLGQPVFDSLDKPVLDSLDKPVLDSLSKPVLDSLDKPVLDSLSKPVLDSLGNHQKNTTTPPTTITSGLPKSDEITIQKPTKKTRKERRAERKQVADSTVQTTKVDHEGHDHRVDINIGQTDTIQQPATSNILTPQQPIIDTLKEQVFETYNRPLLDSLAQPVLDSLGQPRVESAKRPVLDSLGQPTYMQKSDTATLATTNPRDKDTTERLIRAFRSVQLYNKDYQMACDSLVGYSVDSTMSLFHSPVLWNDKNQINSEQMDIYSKDEKLDWVDFIGNPLVVQKIDTLHYNQAKSRSMQAYFVDNNINLAHMKGNVLNYYYQQDDVDSTIESFAVLEKAELKMHFKDRAVTRMIWLGQGQTIIYPIDQIPSDQAIVIEGFQWITKARATSARDICTRAELPSNRKQAQSYRQPTFYIEKKVNAYKKKILEEGIWTDRVDRPIYTVDFFTNETEFIPSL